MTTDRYDVVVVLFLLLFSFLLHKRPNFVATCNIYYTVFHMLL